VSINSSGGMKSPKSQTVSGVGCSVHSCLVCLVGVWIALVCDDTGGVTRDWVSLLIDNPIEFSFDSFQLCYSCRTMYKE
jgi:hypothetical protein